MPNNDDHSVYGGIIGLLCYFGYTNLKNTKPTILGAVGSSLLGGTAAKLPDYLEPPTSPNHRGFFHSKSMGVALTSILQRAAESMTLSDEGKLLTAIVGFSYLSHLALDSKTNKGLPLY